MTFFGKRIFKTRNGNVLLNIYMVILLADKTELKEKTKKQQQKKTCDG